MWMRRRHWIWQECKHKEERRWHQDCNWDGKKAARMKTDLLVRPKSRGIGQVMQRALRGEIRLFWTRYISLVPSSRLPLEQWWHPTSWIQWQRRSNLNGTGSSRRGNSLMVQDIKMTNRTRCVQIQFTIGLKSLLSYKWHDPSNEIMTQLVSLYNSKRSWQRLIPNRLLFRKAFPRIHQYRLFWRRGWHNMRDTRIPETRLYHCCSKANAIQKNSRETCSGHLGCAGDQESSPVSPKPNTPCRHLAIAYGPFEPWTCGLKNSSYFCVSYKET